MVSIVCPIFNSREEQIKITHDCLKSIEDNTNIPYELILIDDCSKLKDNYDYKNVRLIEHEVNKGLAYNWNEGVRESRYKYICIVNSDIVVFPGWMEALIEVFRFNKKGFAFPTPISGMEETKRRWGNTFSDGMVYGACFLTTKETMEDIKEGDQYFDENFCPCWFEDMDMWRRAENKKLMLRMTSKSFVKHLGHQTVSLLPEANAIYEKNKKYYLNKHGMQNNKNEINRYN